jgi:hypothetical protein
MRNAFIRFVCPALLAATTIAAGAPAGAITFSKLTTIYIGNGIRDNGGALNEGIATSFHCANVSGLTANVRFLVLAENGAPRASHTLTLVHGASTTVSTHATEAHAELSLVTGSVDPGILNIESTQSDVFCAAETINAADPIPIGVSRNLVRVNPHPGTVE